MPDLSFRFDIFLSYNHAQKDWARRLARRLRDDRFTVWFDEWELPKLAGLSWVDSLTEAVQQSRKVVLVWSPEFFASSWPEFEANVIQQMDPIGRQQRVVPLLHTPCEIPKKWGFRQWLDFTKCVDGSVEFEFRYHHLLYNLDSNRPFEGDLERFKVLYSGSIEPLSRIPGKHSEAKQEGKTVLRRLMSLLILPSAVRTARLRVGIGIVGVLVGLVSIGIFMARTIGRRPPPSPTTERNLYERVFRDMAGVHTWPVTCSGRVTTGAISPDGTHIVYAEYEPFDRKLNPSRSQQDLYLKSIDTSPCTDTAKPPQLQGSTEPGTYQQLFFSRDGAFVYYVHALNNGDSTLYRTAVRQERGEQVPVELESRLDGPVALSRDRKQYAFIRTSNSGKIRSSSIVIRDVPNSAGYDRPERVFKLQGRWGTQYFNQTLAWSPDGQTISVLVNNIGWLTTNLIGINVATGEERLISSGGEWNQLGNTEWLSDGSGIILEEQDPGSYTQLFAISYPQGQKRQVITQSEEQYDGLSLSDDSRKLVTIKHKLEFGLRIAPAPESEPPSEPKLKNELAGTSGLAWMPDGGRLVYTALDPHSSKSSLVLLINVDAKNFRAEDPKNNLPLLGSPEETDQEPVAVNNSTIVFARTEKGKPSNIWKMYVREPHNPTPITSGGSDFNPTVSDKWLVYQSAQGGRISIWKTLLEKPLGPTPEKPQQVIPFEWGSFYNPDLSPDGRWLAVRAFPNGRRAVMILPMDPVEMKLIDNAKPECRESPGTGDLAASGTAGGPLRVRSGDHRMSDCLYIPQTPSAAPWGSPIRWKDTETLTYIENVNGVSNIWGYSLKTRTARPLTTSVSGQIRWFAWSRGGRLAAAGGKVESDLVEMVDSKPGEP